MKTLDTFTLHYLIAAMWSSVDGEDVSLDINYCIDDLTDAAIDRAIDDCAQFNEAAQSLLEQAYNDMGSDYCDPEFHPEARAGHDFWFTRNGHVVGFWDRTLGEVGEKLSVIAKSFKKIDLYVGDDGKLYFM